MLLNSVVIVLREVLEAALLVSVFLASARFLHIKNRWIGSAIVFGFGGAIAYSYFLEPVSELFNGVGQEVCNALLQLVAFALLTAIAYCMPRRGSAPRSAWGVIPTLMAVAVALAITREGAEILVFVSGFWSVSDFFSAIVVGSVTGAGIGLSIGVLIYYLLLAQPRNRALPVSGVLLLLIAAGISSQATRLLIQADWVPSGAALWDTSEVLSEQSLVGQLLYALIGYEASPTAIEVIVYVGSILLVATAFFAGWLRAGWQTGESE